MTPMKDPQTVVIFWSAVGIPTYKETVGHLVDVSRIDTYGKKVTKILN